MAAYDLLSRVYDAMLEPLYAAQRRIAADALDLRPGSVVLDVPCGTGQSFPELVSRVGGGRVVGVDLSEGMLREARRRVAAQGWTRIDLLAADAVAVAADALPARPDRLHVFLGMSVFPDPDRRFGHLWDLLAPGGRAVVVDVHAERPGIQGRMVEWMAGADLRRRFWDPLERRGIHFERRALPERWEHGGAISLATARKP